MLKETKNSSLIFAYNKYIKLMLLPNNIKDIIFNLPNNNKQVPAKQEEKKQEGELKCDV